MTNKDVDILIVGAGLAGAATAYHLSQRSLARLLVVEQEPMLGVHSSGRNASIVRRFGVDPLVQPLMEEGAEFLRSASFARYDRRGLILLGLGDVDVRGHFPRARGLGRWCPDDGVVEVAALLQAYLWRISLRFDTRVLGWSEQNGRLRVETTTGDVTCELVVNAAGPWAGTLGNLPLTPTNRHLMCTPPIEWVDPDWPCVWDTEVGLYFRPESGGLLLCCCDETPAEPGDYRHDPNILDTLADKLARSQPGLGELAVQSTWVGQRTFAPDRRFVIGFDPRDPRVFHVAGLGGHGVTSSYAVGRLAADLILGRAADSDGTFDPARML